MLAVFRGMLQQKESRRGHVIRDVAQVPFATRPQRTEVRGLLFRIIAFART
jgi:hypothetical protein